MPFKAVVVSTGGGAVVKRQNWGYMQHGVVVWLTGSPELLSRRALRDGTASRPLLSQNNGETPQAVRPWTVGVVSARADTHKCCIVSAEGTEEYIIASCSRSQAVPQYS